MKIMLEKCLMVVWVGLAFCGSLSAGTPPPAVIAEKATLWMDASQLTVDTELTSWSDVRGGNYPVATTYTGTKPKVISVESGPLAGKPAVTFYSVGTSCDMRFALQYVKMAFFVVDLDQAQNAFLLGYQAGGGGSDYIYVFHRGSNGTYQYSNAYVNGCTYYNDGWQVMNPTGTVVPTGYQLITWSKGTEGKIDCFTNDRGISGRIGGKRLCEVILFNEQLSLVQQARVEAYLRAKWFGESAMAGDYVLRKAQTRYDASATASLHLGTDGDSADKVEQWDDLTGHGRHLTPNPCGDTTVYGGMSTIGGRPVYDMGATGSGIDLKMASTLNSRGIVMVTEIDKNANAFWLGDQTKFQFHRGTSGQYAYNHPNNLLKDAEGWQNGAKVTSMLNAVPNAIGGLSVYVFNQKSAATWQYLSSDRGSSGRNGGKRLAELATFEGGLDTETREEVERYLIKKWSPTSEYLQALMAAAWVHVSAAAEDNFLCTNGAITGWKNEGVGGDLYKEATHAFEGGTIDIQSGTRGYTNGVPAFLMGPVSSGIDLAFPRSTGIWNVFWVMDIQQNPAAFFLGDSSDYNFHRGNNGTYAYTVGPFQNALISCDNVAVADIKNTRVPTGLHVFEAETSQASVACYLSVDRGCRQSVGVNRNGGRALSELLVLTNHVTGLTRVGVGEYLASRWTKRCGWAGAGDADWGATSYRVFDADATVPADAAAVGIGFTGDATLTGGPLAVGNGGVFISEDVTAALSVTMPANQAPLALYGPGTFAVRSALDYRLDLSHFEKGRVLVENGGTWTLPVSAEMQMPALTVEAGGRLVLDLANVELPAQVKFDSLELPPDAELSSWASVANAPEGGAGLQMMDGNTLWVLAASTPRIARWCGNGEVTNVSDVANWSCTDFAGNPVVSAPTKFTSVIIEGSTTFNVPRGQSLVCRELSFSNVALARDSDWRGLTQPLQGAIDLAGHTLQLSQFTGDASLMNSSSTVIGELYIDVPQGATAENASIGFTGAIKVVKVGDGRYLNKKQHSYAGGTIIREGTFAAFNSGTGSKTQYVYSFNNFAHFGLAGSAVAIESEGRLEVQGNNYLNVYAVELAGGTLAVTQNAMELAQPGICGFTLTKDSTIETSVQTILNSPTGGEMLWTDLGGHRLTIDLLNNVTTHCANRGFTNGTIEVKGDPAKSSQFVMHSTPNDFRGVTLLMNGHLNLEVDSQVGDLVFGESTNSYAPNNGHLDVYGTLTLKGGYWHNCVLQDGAALDLSYQTDPMPLVSPITTPVHTIAFAEGARITVKMGERAVSVDQQLLAWSEEEDPPDAEFVLDGNTAYRLSVEADGLYCRSNGTVIFLR